MKNQLPIKEKNFSIMVQIGIALKALFKDDEKDTESEDILEELKILEKEQNSEYIKNLENMVEENTIDTKKAKNNIAYRKIKNQ